MPVSVLVVAVYALATARLTALITDDEITRVPREAILRRLTERPSHLALGYLLTCSWCVSCYVGAALAPLVWWHGTSAWLAIPALALAWSQITGMIHAVGRN